MYRHSMHFNSRAHVERDIIYYIIQFVKQNFNSRAHVERDDYVENNGDYSFNFNSRAHVERDGYVGMKIRHNEISTHALTWSATYSRPKRATRFTFQLTRSRGARLITRFGTSLSCGFQLTRSRGARPCRPCRQAETCHFNSRAHVERDFKGGEKMTDESYISTHALTWSATSVVIIRLRNVTAFQLTRSRGARPLCSRAGACAAPFQLTRSRGARLIGRIQPTLRV